jgi:A/G-specific adenine glycosylase
VQALAAAPLEQVLKDWEGLGYYSRARNLHRAARTVAERPGATFPADVEGLLALPGIGAYTAGAIASMAYGLPEPAVDGNQVRVLSRLFGIRGSTALPATKKAIREAAQRLLDRERPGDFNQALMGMGALVCLPRKPRCENCPGAPHCRALALDIREHLPELPERLSQRLESRAVALVYHGERVLVRQRPEEGLLGGLWEFPHFLGVRRKAELREALLEMGVTPRSIQKGPTARHVFTHMIWEMRGYVVMAASGESPSGRFVTGPELEALPMATAQRVYREEAMKAL